MTKRSFPGSVEIGPFFVGRQSELEILRRELAGPTAKTVAISGPAGIGKTALAMAFAASNRDAFSAGVYNLHATPFEALDESVRRVVSSGVEPYLIILNELDARPQETVDHELSLLRQAYPNARVVLTSRVSQASSGVDLQLRLGGLSQAETRELLRKRLAYHASPELVPGLYELALGNPLATTLAADLLSREDVTPRQLLERLHAFTRPGVFDREGERIPDDAPAHRQIVADVVAVSDQFLHRLHNDPNLLHQLTPRGFEEIVAELLARLDYEVKLTPASRDGGKDIYAAHKGPLGTFLYLVECKKYAPDHPVGVGLVRQLNGVVQAAQATAGILATTSFFTRGAREFQKMIPFQISPKDYVGIQEWLEAALKRRQPNNRMQRTRPAQAKEPRR
jgi:restriction system protein